MSNCVFPSEGDPRVCTACGRSVSGFPTGPLYAPCASGSPGVPSPAAPHAGPGRELTGIIHDAQLGWGSCFVCEDRARQMNEWGIEGCLSRVEEISAWLRHSWRELEWRDRLRAAIHLAGLLDWRRPIESLVELAIERARRKTLSVFVLGHQETVLGQVRAARHLRTVFLPDIDANCRLAESRVFLAGGPFDAPPDSAYLGLATASWQRKYGPHEEWNGRKWPHCLPLERLDLLELQENVVWCAAITDDEDWAFDLDHLFPGCDALVDELIDRFGLAHKHELGPLANNFVAHRDVTLDHARWMRSAIRYLDARYGEAWPISGERHPCFADRLPAFACECASILYFANRPDLELRQIPPPP
ncbi:MAG TPA: hypothetical protein VG826_29280 [Pirellulales bacterium]|nr:hypothetical protein [Pirellulales bacterium]